MDPGLGYIFPNLPESQDATGIELGLYDPSQPMSKEDFGIITTTLDAIANRINVLHNEIGAEKNWKSWGRRRRKSLVTPAERRATGHPIALRRKPETLKRRLKTRTPATNAASSGTGSVTVLKASSRNPAKRRERLKRRVRTRTSATNVAN
jgi:hypothetical protein